MPRDHARIQTAIWSKPDFRELPVQAQHFYMLALSQPRLSYCGVLDYMPARLAKFSAKATTKSVTNAVTVLEDRGFVVVDHDTEELLIRTFVRHDGLLTSPNVTKAMVKDYQAVLSEHIKEVIVHELSRVFTASPELKGWQGLREASTALHSLVTGKGSRKGSDNG